MPCTDTDVYENTRICTVAETPDINQEATELQGTEKQYEQLRFDSREGACNIENKDNKAQAIQWKDQPNQIRYSIYALSLMMMILLIIVITAVVVIHVPKDEKKNNSGDRTWTLWSQWLSCDATCDKGTQTRLRFCYSPFVSSGQLDCEGSSIESRICQKDPCPGDRTWTLWSQWLSCDATCDKGTQTRLRFCYSPFVSSAQLDCEGSSIESKICQKDPCPVGGTWTIWSAWSNCDITCDNGTQTRLRLCYNPSIPTEQFDCKGSSTESRVCLQKPCHDGGSWSNWGGWGSCSESCGGGVKSRLRTCTSPRPSVLRKGCDGSSEQIVLCNKNTCDGLKVSFLATGRTAENSSNAIKFPSIVFNSGNCYSSSTGRFTCKIPGIYNFAVTLTKVRRDIDLISAVLRINGGVKLKLYSDPSDTGDTDYGSYSLSVTGNFHLNTNDYVDVYSIPNNFVNDYSSSFTGVLVIPDN